MAIVTRITEEGGTVSFPEVNCCTFDAQSRNALLCYYLALLLKKLGGDDYTNCDAVLAEWALFKDYDQAHMDLVISELVGTLLQENGITVTLEEARANSACFRNTFPAWALQSLQIILWDQIVDAVTP